LPTNGNHQGQSRAKRRQIYQKTKPIQNQSFFKSSRPVRKREADKVWSAVCTPGFIGNNPIQTRCIMPDSGDRGGDLYDSDMGDGVTGGNVGFDRSGPGFDHHVVHGDDRHFSWDTDPSEDSYGVHGREHNPRQPW